MRAESEGAMRGYVVQRGQRFCAVIYEGLDPITGRERRRWHPAGTSRDDAELLARQLADDAGACTRATRPGAIRPSPSL